jgi:cytochrome c5
MTFDALHPCPFRHATPEAERRTGARRGGALVAGALLVCALALCGCGASSTSASNRTASVPAYVTEPFTPEQKLVEQGASLIVADGCSACHLNGAARAGAPDFSSFAGHRVKLVDGRTVLVDERFLREGLLDPRANELSGYGPAPMLAAIARLHLASHSGQVAALAAFIEQVGPEPE